MATTSLTRRKNHTSGRKRVQMSRTIKAGHVYRQYSKDGMPIADYKSSRLAHEATGVSLGSIARAAHGERKTGGGYLWRVVPENLPWEQIQVDLSSKIGYHDKRPLIQLTLDGEVVQSICLSRMPAAPLISAAEVFPVLLQEPRRQPADTGGLKRKQRKNRKKRPENKEKNCDKIVQN